MFLFHRKCMGSSEEEEGEEEEIGNVKLPPEWERLQTENVKLQPT
jgi:hypothetical protein